MYSLASECDSWFALYMETANLKSYLLSFGFLEYYAYHNNMKSDSCTNPYCPVALGGVCGNGRISYQGSSYYRHGSGIYF